MFNVIKSFPYASVSIFTLLVLSTLFFIGCEKDTENIDFTSSSLSVNDDEVADEFLLSKIDELLEKMENENLDEAYYIGGDGVEDISSLNFEIDNGIIIFPTKKDYVDFENTMSFYNYTISSGSGEIKKWEQENSFELQKNDINDPISINDKGFVGIENKLYKMDKESTSIYDFSGNLLEKIHDENNQIESRSSSCKTKGDTDYVLGNHEGKTPRVNDLTHYRMTYELKTNKKRWRDRTATARTSSYGNNSKGLGLENADFIALGYKIYSENKEDYFFDVITRRNNEDELERKFTFENSNCIKYGKTVHKVRNDNFNTGVKKLYLR